MVVVVVVVAVKPCTIAPTHDASNHRKEARIMIFKRYRYNHWMKKVINSGFGREVTNSLQ